MPGFRIGCLFGSSAALSELKKSMSRMEGFIRGLKK